MNRLSPLKVIIGLFSGLVLLCACQTTKSPSTRLIWVEGTPGSSSGTVVNELLVIHPPVGTDWDIWGVFQESCYLPAHEVEGSEMAMEEFDGLCFRLFPVSEATGDTLRLRYEDNPIANHSKAPQGFTLLKHGLDKPEFLSLEYQFLEEDPLPVDSFHLQEVHVWDMVPQIKQVTATQGSTPKDAKSVISYIKGKPKEWYRIILDGSIRIEASDEAGAYYAGLTLERLKENASSLSGLPCMIIEDYPDMPVRALMVDVGRNFITKDQMCRIVDVMSRCKMNTLIIHLTEDEGWRLEIRGLPELTKFAAYHDVPRLGEDGEYHLGDGLYPMQDGRVGHDIDFGGGTGYYTREEFKEILRYALEKHVEVVPELDVPGHSGSAILAMERRHENTGEDCLLTHPDDTSAYMAYMGYRHNVLDPGLDATYRFIGTVLDDLKAMYGEAGIPLKTVAISGDEVAEGCWLESPACKEMIREHHWTTTRDIWDYFIDKVNGMLQERDIRLAGYFQIVQDVTPATLEHIRRNASYIIAWHPLVQSFGMDSIPYLLANKGIPVLLSNADYTYMDNASSWNKHEQGLTWAGVTDLRKAWSYEPLVLYKGEDAIRNPLHSPENIIGVEPMIWGDDIFTFEQDCQMLFPKVYGLFERCWNAKDPDTSDEAFERFQSIIHEHELNYLDREGIAHRPQRAIR